MELKRDNAKVLSNLGYTSGRELAPRRVDFNLVFPSIADRSQNEGPVGKLGFGWEPSETSVKSGTFEATAFRELHPELDAITEAEIALIEQVTPCGGFVDGWGFFRDTVH